MRVGYARVSTLDQNPELQIDALKKAGCEEIFTDKMSGAKADRPGLEKALAYMRAGDILVVWKLDRAGRSLKNLIELVQALEQREVDFISVTEQFDTSTPGGKLIFHIMGALAEFERSLIRERTNAGLAGARARGRKGGRPRESERKLQQALTLYNAGVSAKEVCERFEISEATLYRYQQKKRKEEKALGKEKQA